MEEAEPPRQHSNTVRGESVGAGAGQRSDLGQSEASAGRVTEGPILSRVGRVNAHGYLEGIADEERPFKQRVYEHMCLWVRGRRPEWGDEDVAREAAEILRVDRHKTLFEGLERIDREVLTDARRSAWWVPWWQR